MKIGLLCLLTVFVSCQRTELSGPGRIEDAYITDSSRIANGCEDTVALVLTDLLGNSIQYKPTPATLPVYQQALQDIPAPPNSTTRAVKISLHRNRTTG